MSQVKYSAKNWKACAFCKHWYDPANSCLELVDSYTLTFRFDGDVKRKCMLRNVDKPGWTSCGQYECKIQR